MFETTTYSQYSATSPYCRRRHNLTSTSTSIVTIALYLTNWRATIFRAKPWHHIEVQGAKRMTPSRQPLIFGISLIALGAGWLLNNLQITPDVNWVWTLGLGIAGIAFVVTGGINKVTIILGPFLVVASVLSYLRQNGELSAAYEMPGLTALLGILLLLSYIRIIPPPTWYGQADVTRKSQD
jgi:hypothetical protein